jgi:CHAT domain-containing protein/tetratricopeptide (TPR) repeat protein
MGTVLHGWGDDLFMFGEYEAAFEKYKQAIEMYQSPELAVRVGTVYNSIGRLYRRHNQLDVALDYQRRALKIHERTGRPASLMQSLNAVGVTLQSLGRDREARVYLERALEIARQAQNPRTQDFVAANLSSTLMAEGAYDAAATVLEGVIARKLDEYPAYRWRSLAEAYLRLGRLDDAMRAAEESIAICGTRQDLACIDGREIRAAVHLARKDRAAAIVDLETAVAMLEEARARLIPADFFKQQFGQMQTALFDFAIEMQLSEGKPREALETAERARSRAFLDLLASQDLAGPSAGRTGSDDESSLASERTAQPPTSADLTAIASRLGSTLVVYWVGATHVFIWTVQPDGKIEAATVHIPETTLATLVASVAPFGRAGAGFDRGSSSSWRRLHDLLIKPIRHALPRKPGALVTIVPHGPLSMLSFAALQDDRSRYLIEDYTLHYVPAAAILQFTPSRRQRASGSRDTLVIADPSLPKRSVLEQPLLGLPGARREARAIASGVPASRVTILEGTAASEGSVRANTTRKKVLHFATHAIVSDAEPLKSFLALASTGTGAAQDGILTAQEVYGLRLEADLVLLSACRSGGGRLTGDGMTTFARAFIYAGTPSLITSVWDVADESSSHLVPEFYRHWRNGASKASALRTAQLDFLKKLRAGTFSVETSAGPVLLPEHPALWAGFTLIGEPD